MTKHSMRNLRDFFRNPEKAAMKLSPDGKYVSWTASFKERMNIFVQALTGGEERRITNETARNIEGYFWKGDRVLYVKDFGGDENYHVVSVDDEGQGLKDLTPGEKVRAEIVDVLEDDERFVLLEHNRRDAKVFDVYRVDVRTGEETLVAQNPGNVTRWITDHEGKLRVANVAEGVNYSILYRETEQEDFRPILTDDFKEMVAPLLFTFDNRRLYVASNRGRDKAAIFEFDPATGREGALICEHPDVDVEILKFSRKRKVLLHAEYITWKQDRTFLDEEARGMYERVQGLLPGYEIYFMAHDKAEEKFIVGTWNDRTRGKRYLFEKGSGKLTLLGELRPWLKEEEMAEMKPITYRARDGLLIHGYLTVPRGIEPRGLPVVVNPHGGPWHRDEWCFDTGAQFLADRGYAVLHMNFRGSWGYGKAFWKASFRQWGRRMQDDITDGVEWLIREGIADPRRIAIYGASYGGYATLAGITMTPDLYAAAVDYVGVANLLTFMKTIPPYWEPHRAMLYEMVGDPEKDRAEMEAASPVFLADRIKTPLLIAQGANDPRVNKNESDQMVAALKRRGVEVEYLVKENEGHGFHNEENRFEFYEAMERFLAKHLQG